MNNGKTATKRLIALLNKHGIKWDNRDGFNILRTHWERNGTSYTFTESRLNGTTAFEAYSQMTPEQAIAATLGNDGIAERKTCKNVSNPSSGFLCSKCGWGDFDEPSHLLTTAKFTDNDGGPNYCPNCGAKVVDNE